MPDTAYDISVIRGTTMRVTRLDNCGTPTSGSGGMWVGKNFVSVKGTKNYDDGNEIKIPNANDEIVVYEKGRKTLLNIDLVLEFATFDTSVIPLMTGDSTITDAGPLTAGWLEQALASLGNYFALEVWQNIPNQQCVGGLKKYYYHLWPFIENGAAMIGDISNAASNKTVQANTRSGTNWLKGPYDIISSSAVAAVPAWLPSNLPSKTQHVEFVTTIAPPVPSGLAGLQILTPVSS